MNLEPSADQQALIAGAQDMLDRALPAERVREMARTGTHAWRGAVAEIGANGWTALLLPEEEGGLGLGFAESTLLLRELGRRMAPGPWVPWMLAARLASAGGRSALTSRIATGDALVGACIGDLVVDAEAGDTFLRLTDAGAELVTAHDVVPLHAVDPLGCLGRAGGFEVLAAVDGPWWVAGLRVLAAAFLTGLAWAALEESVDYVGVRRQFGVPIGSFQAVKHTCADMRVRVEAAESQTLVAAMLLDADEGDGPFHAAAALHLAVESARNNGADNLQNHGAVGYTAEHAAHLVVKRAHTVSTLYGDPARLRGALLDSDPATQHAAHPSR